MRSLSNLHAGIQATTGVSHRFRHQGEGAVTIFHFVFLVIAFYAIYIQARSYALQEATEKDSADAGLMAQYAKLLAIRRFMSPFMAGSAAILVSAGAFVFQNTSLFLGAVLTGIWVSACIGDIFVEGSYSVSDEKVKARYYTIGMVLFVVVTLGLGVGLIINGVLFNTLPNYLIFIAIGVSIVMGIVAYFTLDVSPENLGIVLVYTVAVSTLLCGGIMSTMIGDTHLGYIGIAYFISDWCVGLRDFGKKVPQLLNNNLTIIILILYYTIMLTSIDFVM